MFSGTIAENMRNVKPDATDEEIIEALKLSCAWDFVEKLPDGIQSVVKERGGGFSEGQAQRLSIARALLRKSPILLLDEATSALDAENEKNVVRSIETLKRRSTLIVVAHKLETVRMADKIVVMDSSCKVAETGTHNELIALEGEYKDFWDKRNASSQWQLA